jgi:K+-transporting ATPase A subunit
MGTADRAVRIVIALVIACLYLLHQISGTLALILMIVATAFIVTSFIGWCPSYLPFGISTRKSPSGPTTPA